MAGSQGVVKVSSARRDIVESGMMICSVGDHQSLNLEFVY